MNISDGLKLRGRPAMIPDAIRLDLPDFFVQQGYRRGVEIGVDKGEFSVPLVQAGLDLWGVDPWRQYGDYDQPQAELDSHYGKAMRKLRDFPNFHPVRKTSMEAVGDFEDQSLDFVYIDGHHGFKFVTEDIFEWSKKVRYGGWVGGHDFALGTGAIDSPWVLQVPYVVRAYAAAFNIRRWYVIGRQERVEGERRDRFRSWFWLKT